MTVPQFGIFAQGTIAHAFVEFDLLPDVNMDLVAESLRGLRQPAVSAGGVNLVVAFGSDLWRALAVLPRRVVDGCAADRRLAGQ